MTRSKDAWYDSGASDDGTNDDLSRPMLRGTQNAYAMDSRVIAEREFEPRRDRSRTRRNAVRFTVPLKASRSIKCAVPAFAAVS